MKNEIYNQPYFSYTLRILKSGTLYTGQVVYGNKVYYESEAGWIGRASWICTKHLLIHLKWWVRTRGHKTKKGMQYANK